MRWELEMGGSPREIFVVVVFKTQCIYIHNERQQRRSIG